ncbi:hypothetical protein D9M69_369400 [compost metagenome]
MRHPVTNHAVSSISTTGNISITFATDIATTPRPRRLIRSILPTFLISSRAVFVILIENVAPCSVGIDIVLTGFSITLNVAELTHGIQAKDITEYTDAVTNSRNHTPHVEELLTDIVKPGFSIRACIDRLPVFIQAERIAQEINDFIDNGFWDIRILVTLNEALRNQIESIRQFIQKLLLQCTLSPARHGVATNLFHELIGSCTQRLSFRTREDLTTNIRQIFFL